MGMHTYDLAMNHMGDLVSEWALLLLQYCGFPSVERPEIILFLNGSSQYLLRMAYVIMSFW